MTTTGSIKQQASTHAVTITLPKEELESKFNVYWEQVKDILPASLTQEALKGGFRKVTRSRVVKAAGGRKQFFKPTLMEVVEEFLGTQDRQALAFNDVTLSEEHVTEGEITKTNAVVTGLVYLEPEIKWKKKPGIDEPLVIKTMKEPPDLLERLVKEELTRKQEASVVLAPATPETPVVDDHVVVVSAKSWIMAEDGTATQWNDGTFKNNKWLVSKGVLKQAEIYDAMLGMKAQESKTLEFKLSDRFGADANKNVRLTLTLEAVFNKQTPAIDDDLAKTNGFDTLEALTTDLTRSFTKKLETQRERVRKLGVLNALASPDVVEVEPVPFVWMLEKARSLYMEGRQYVQSEAEFVARFNGAQCMNGIPVTDKSTLMQFLGERAATELMQDLIFRSWGKQKGVEGDTNLRNIDKFVGAVRAEIDKVVKVEEIEAVVPAE